MTKGLQKALVSVVVVLLLIMGLGRCGGDDTTASVPEPAPPAPTTAAPSVTPSATPTPTPTPTSNYVANVAEWSVELTVDDANCDENVKWCLLEYTTDSVSGDVTKNPIPVGKSVKVTYRVSGRYPYQDSVVVDGAEQNFHPVSNAVEAKSDAQYDLKAKVVAVSIIDTKDEGSINRAATAVKELTVKGRAPKTGYSRAKFGDDWSKHYTDCDTRELILRRDIDKVKVASADRCKVIGGEFYDPYTGKTTKITPSNISKQDVDHIVPLSDAWQKGAQSWSAAKRTAFANDPANLVLTAEKINSQKSDGDAATWLPPKKSNRCDYVTRQVTVKQNYGLWVTAAEQASMIKVLASCSDDDLITEDTHWLNEDTKATVVKPKAKPKPKPKAEPEAPSNCTPGYSPCLPPRSDYDCADIEGSVEVYGSDPYRLDADGDGVGCDS